MPKGMLSLRGAQLCERLNLIIPETPSASILSHHHSAARHNIYFCLSILFTMSMLLACLCHGLQHKSQ